MKDKKSARLQMLMFLERYEALVYQFGICVGRHENGLDAGGPGPVIEVALWKILDQGGFEEHISALRDSTYLGEDGK